MLDEATRKEHQRMMNTLVGQDRANYKAQMFAYMYGGANPCAEIQLGDYVDCILFKPNVNRRLLLLL